jgi:hypothetical protein
MLSRFEVSSAIAAPGRILQIATTITPPRMLSAIRRAQIRSHARYILKPHQLKISIQQERVGGHHVSNPFLFRQPLFCAG